MVNIIDTLITDRTQADVDRAKHLKSLWDARAHRWTGTPAEWEEWLNKCRGEYRFTDMNRVREAVSYLTGRLSEFGYTIEEAGSVVPAFSILLSVDPAGSGDAQGGGIFYQGEQAAVAAVPSHKHNFVGWMENGMIVSTDPAYTFPVERSRSLTAVFALKQYAVSVSTDPEGAGELTGGGVYDVDTVVTLSVRPAEGYAFTRWTRDGAAVGDGPEYSFALEADTSVVAVMTKMHVISVAVGADGGGTASGGGTYLDGQTVTLSAVSGDGYAFAGWREGDGAVSADEIYTFTATKDRTLTAEFVRLHTVTLLVDPAGGGEASGGGVYRAGEQITVSAAASEGNRFVGWFAAGERVSANAEYTFTVNGSMTLTAKFEEIPVYSVSVGIGPDQEGFGTVSGAGSYREGTSVTVTAQAADGYRFSAWQEGGQTVSEDAEYTFTVTGNRDLAAVFAKFSRLPEGYTEVEYIESGEKCYIDTNVAPQSSITSGAGKSCDTAVELEVEPLSAPTSTSKYLIYSAGTISSVTAYYYISWKTTKGAYAYLSTGSSGAAVAPITDTSLRRMKLSLDGSARKFTVDGSTCSTGTQKILSATASKIKLLGSSASSKTDAKLYSCKIYKGTALPLVRDFVPCIDPSGAVGLYDLVEGKFYANSGTGVLTAGPAV